MTGRDRFLVLLSTLIALGMLAGYMLTGTTATISVDGIVTRVRTHSPTVGGVLAEIGVAVEDEDILHPPAAATLTPGSAIDVKRARRITLVVDNRRSELVTIANTTSDILSQAIAQPSVARSTPLIRSPGTWRLITRTVTARRIAERP